MKVRLRPGVTVEGTIVTAPERRWTLAASWRPVLELLEGAGATEDELAERAPFGRGPMRSPAGGAGGPRRFGGPALADLYHLLDRFTRGGALVHSLPGLAERVPMGPVPPVPARVEAGRLSPFAFLRPDGGRMVLETPLAPARLVFLDWRGPALSALLAGGADAAGLAGAVPGVSEAEASRFLALLQASGALEGHAEVPETWEFHDLLFHSRSRRGRHDRPYGGTWRFPGNGPEALVSREGPFHPLPAGDGRVDLPLARALEERRSHREHGEDPLTREQLGEFLHRTARVVRTSESDRGPLAHRPYPGGGARHELEIYPVVHRCQGLEAGLYNYDPARHGLVAVPSPERDRAALLQHARAATGMPGPPQVLLVMAARYGRMAWKYESMAYATILKDVGVLYQTMYLVATAMGLAACAVGGGDSDLFARAAGTDYYEEGSVGEFLLGSSPTGSRSR